MTKSIRTDEFGARSALARCIAMPAAKFADEVWGKRWLLTRADQFETGFEDLFSEHVVDELVSRRGMRVPFARMVNGGKDLPTSDFTRGGGVGATIDDQVADDKVLVAMADGATLVTQALHRTWPPLVEFAAKLATELGHPVRINAYITPPQNQGLTPHHDIHDVFVLQIAGRKRWIVHRPVVEAAIVAHQVTDPQIAAHAKNEEPVLNTVLEAGDVLYLPRGMVHAAATEGDMSIHLTVGVPPLTRYDLIQHLLETVRDDVELRSSLPMGVDLTDPAVLSEHLGATVDALRARLEEVDLVSAAKYLRTAMMERTRPEPIAPLEQLALARDLDHSTKLRTRIGIQHHQEVIDGQIRLLRHERFITFPMFVQDALRLALSGTAFTPADLPGLEADDQISFTRRLVREGVLVPVETE